MSYSFAVQAPDKAALVAAVAAKMDDVVRAQPVHEVDRAAVMAHLDGLIALLPDVDDRDLAASVNGYVAGTWEQGKLLELTGVSSGVQIGWVARAVVAEPPAPEAAE